MFKENSVIFHFSKLTTTWKKSKSPSSFVLKGFGRELCVINCLKQYLLITNPLRNEKTTQLLISYTNPHKLMSVDTVSRWLREFLRLSETINTSIFTKDSTTTASASKAKQVGLSLPEILKRGQWTNKTTFETFYNKPSADNSLEIFKGK